MKVFTLTEVSGLTGVAYTTLNYLFRKKILIADIKEAKGSGTSRIISPLVAVQACICARFTGYDAKGGIEHPGVGVDICFYLSDILKLYKEKKELWGASAGSKLKMCIPDNVSEIKDTVELGIGGSEPIGNFFQFRHKDKAVLLHESYEAPRFFCEYRFINLTGLVLKYIQLLDIDIEKDLPPLDSDKYLTVGGETIGRGIGELC